MILLEAAGPELVADGERRLTGFPDPMEEAQNRSQGR
jgi:hypothetical protein